MSEVRVEVVRVNGNCIAGFENGDSFSLRGLEIIPQRNKKTCQVALASIFQNVGRLRIQESPIYISCPDPGTGEGGNVVFELSLEKIHELDTH